MTYLRNIWYAVAWSDEIDRTPLGRTILEEPVVFYRTEAGKAVAIGGRCPHRFAPLANGKLIGDAVQCPYHGLQFGTDGRCVHSPHGDGRVPEAAKVPAYIVAEKHGLVWLWTGAIGAANFDLIPDLSHLDNPALGTVKGYMSMNAHYQLGIDNLIDLSHTQFVHNDTLQSDGYDDGRVEVVQVGQTVTVKLSMPNSPVPIAYKRHVHDPDGRVDYWLDATWSAPGMVLNDVGVTEPGQAREAGIRSTGLHICTPAGARTAHYFYAHSRNTKIDDPEVDEQIRRWHHHGFAEQDKPIIESSAAMMGDEVDPLKLGAVLLPTDGGAVRARRLLAKMIRDEAAAIAA